MINVSACLHINLLPATPKYTHFLQETDFLFHSLDYFKLKNRNKMKLIILKKERKKEILETLKGMANLVIFYYFLIFALHIFFPNFSGFYILVLKFSYNINVFSYK